MAPKHSAQPTGTRGSLSARQWSDLRQAARLARSESVSITWRRDGSILISPLTDCSKTAGNRQHEHGTESRTARDASEPQSMASDDCAPAKTASKKQQRDADRLQKWQAKQSAPQPTARWLLLTKRLLWTSRKASCDGVWTAWMRARASRLEARRKLRSVLWREWTRPHIAPPAHIGPPGSRLRARCQGLLVLGLRSCRDEYILGRARALTRHCSGGSREIGGWLHRHADAMVDHVASPGLAGLTTPVPKARSRSTRGGRGGRGGVSPGGTSPS